MGEKNMICSKNKLCLWHHRQNTRCSQFCAQVTEFFFTDLVFIFVTIQLFFLFFLCVLVCYFSGVNFWWLLHNLQHSRKGVMYWVNLKLFLANKYLLFLVRLPGRWEKSAKNKEKILKFKIRKKLNFVVLLELKRLVLLSSTVHATFKLTHCTTRTGKKCHDQY